MANRDLSKELSQAEQKLNQVQQRLASVEQELATLDVGTPPTTDLAVEEQAALKRLARREGLLRVKAALQPELAQAKRQLDNLREEERLAKEAKIQADVDTAKAALIETLWAAYNDAETFKAHCAELDKVKPDFQSRANDADIGAGRIAGMLEALGAAKVSINGVTFKRMVTRVAA